MQKYPGCAYLAPDGFVLELQEELKNITHTFDRLFLAEGPLQKVAWVQNIWLNPFFYSFKSISEAKKMLTSLQRNWAQYPYECHRRAALLEEQLPYVAKKPVKFLQPYPKAPLGSWTLIDANTLLASPSCSSFFQNGEVHFEETQEPPSRAYLKLYEILTLLQLYPSQNDLCVEIGATPGSWSWVLQKLGCKVFAFDKAPLDPCIAKLPNIHFAKADGFTILPEKFPDAAWVFSDVI